MPKIRRFTPSLQKLEWNCKNDERSLWTHLLQLRPSGIRVKRTRAAPALVAMTTTQVPVIPWEKRHMTVRECSRLQGMGELKHLPASPDCAFKALGNAVCADVVEAIARGLVAPAEPAIAARRSQKVPSRPVSDAGRVDIRPGVSVLSVLRHLNYRPWFALAEFVDNALQSAQTYEAALAKAERGETTLRVSISIENVGNGRIVIRDNAAGIHESEYARAFRTAELPPDQTGLSEFGMGMKSAACWYAPKWTVRTKALGEKVERTISFDIQRIVRDCIEELEIEAAPAPRDAHYTEITLQNVFRLPQNRTLGKIREHLASIYRGFLRNGSLELEVNGQKLAFAQPEVLRAPSFKTPRSAPVEWRKPIALSLGGGKTVRGFAALRQVASTSSAGFALLRRGRLIEGSADEGYRPERIFGRSNSYVFQRLFGELELEGFEVSHTKDGFKWDEAEDDLLDELKEALDAEPLSLLSQAREYRARPGKGKHSTAAVKATEGVGALIEKSGARGVGMALRRGVEERPHGSLPREKALSRRSVIVNRGAEPWRIDIATTLQPDARDWLEVSDRRTSQGGRILGVRIALDHPFVRRFGGADSAAVEPLIRVATALAVAEATARDCGAKTAGTVRRHLNELLRELFSQR
ncbi:MAG: ATP-binding protein [Myxococcales bacterium]